MTKTMLAVLFSSALVYSASAETLGSFINTPRNKELLMTELQSVGVGISSANSYLNVSRQKPIYCPPRKMTMTGAQYLDILSRFVSSNDRLRNADIGAIGPFLVLALAETFPCE